MSPEKPILILVATRNRHKVTEIQALVGEDFDCRSLENFPDAPAVAEDGETFAENARCKAESFRHWLLAEAERLHSRGIEIPRNGYIIGEDSGLEVDALQGAPGVHSARFAADEPSSTYGNMEDTANNQKLLALMETVPMEQRRARFRCVIALLPATPSRDHTAMPRLFEGVCEGYIGVTPHGDQGFGYDPIFIPDGADCSFAELGPAEKNRVSHRARAVRRLVDFFRST